MSRRSAGGRRVVSKCSRGGWPVMQCAIVPTMKIRTARRSLALAVSVLFCCGAAQAQFKAPAKLQPKDGLGSGIGSQGGPVAPKPPASAPEEKASAENVVQDIANCVLAG